MSFEMETKQGKSSRGFNHVTDSRSRSESGRKYSALTENTDLPRRGEERDTKKWQSNKEMSGRFRSRHSRSGYPQTNYRNESQNSDRKRKHSDMSDRDRTSSKEYSFGKNSTDTKEKEKPDFEVSGKLYGSTTTNTQGKSLTVKYVEPTEAKKPNRRWRLYPFKGEDALPTLYIHRQSCYLVGRDRSVCDVPVDHPSCSKQHAVIQYRMVTRKRENGWVDRCVCPYIIDLESANGTFINNVQITTKKYVELFERDVIKFGFSSREYVLLHENSDAGQPDAE